VWNVGKVFGEFGKSTECSGETLETLYGPSKRGMNYATWFSPFRLYWCRRCNVDNPTRSPIANGKSLVLDLFAVRLWEILARARLT